MTLNAHDALESYIQGPVGPQGPQGEPGTPGGPAGPEGPQGPAGADGANGTNGTNGIDGKTILYGTAVPTTEGNDGDFYLKTDTSDLYGPKAGGTWPAGTSLIGPAGATGATGAQGPQGELGPQGPQGVPGSGTVIIVSGAAQFVYNTPTTIMPLSSMVENEEYRVNAFISSTADGNQGQGVLALIRRTATGGIIEFLTAPVFIDVQINGSDLQLVNKDTAIVDHTISYKVKVE